MASEVDIAITGELFSAPRDTAAPTDASTALPAAWIGHGYVSQDGVTESWDDSVDNIVAWQSATVVRAARTESVATLSCTLIQNRGSNLELYHPGSRMAASGSEWMLEVTPANADPRSFTLNVIDGDKLMRIYVGNGEVTERGDITYQNGEPIGYEVTITCYPDADGLLMRKFSTAAAWGEDIAGGGDEEGDAFAAVEAD
ncbi:phage tail tube protein [Streptomyces harbinensis]|uniref:phage tail tube protein n=3 Tax=Actinomycetes TaxID=1760 RepID=UPI0036B2334C